MSDEESIWADAQEEMRELKIARINFNRSLRVNSTTIEPPEYLCEECGLEEGICECEE